MSEIKNLSLLELKTGLEKKEFSSVDIVKALSACYEEDQKHNKPVNGFIEFFDDAQISAAASDKRRAGGDAGELEGLPMAVKDNILITGKTATCGSAVLKGFKAPYSSTVIKRLVNTGAVLIGRTNMDEFAMGSSCEYSIYGPTRNPIDRDRIPGGSSGGSAAVVAAKQSPCALGTETGGSVRLPAAFCGIYGLKPTYGALSRYGIVAYGSSLDQIGVFGRTPDDIGLVFKNSAGIDTNDSTSASTKYTGLYPLQQANIRGLKIAIPNQFTGKGIQPDIQAQVSRFANWLCANGAIVDEIPMPILESTLAIYYIIAPAEASSNLARYDGIRYGFRAEDYVNLESLYTRSRSQGFGSEVKRRIFIGNYVLSSGYYDAYYKKAMEVRTLLRREIAKVFEGYDLILSPTSPCSPFKIGEKTDDPLAMYLTDICTMFVNLSMIPALSIPCGNTTDGLPVGIQLAGNMFKEELLLSVAKAWHESEVK